MTAVSLPSGQRLVGRVRVPSSKSVTNRALNLALLARRPITLERPLRSEDIEAFVAALETAGFESEWAGEELRLEPRRRPTSGEIHCGASGTMARFLTGSLAVLPGSWRLDGVERLRERPLTPLLGALRKLGARVRSEADEGFLPLAIEGASMSGGRVTLDASASSQYASALLMAGARADSPVTVRLEGLVSAPYLELTRVALEGFGARVQRDHSNQWTVSPGLAPPERFAVEADASSACYFAAGAALTGGEVELSGLLAESVQGDRGFLELLARMGAEIECQRNDGICVRGTGGLTAVDVDMADMPDQVPTLAAIAPFARGVTHVRNVAHLRIKESDRLEACATELGRLGATVEQRADGLSIPGVWADSAPPAEPVVVATWDDHRIAMSFALTALRRPATSIDSPGVVAKSYPDYWKDLEGCLAR